MKLLELISQGKILLLDGAMGTQLAAAGAEMGGQSSVRYPDAVTAVHKKYLDAGVDILITNTLTMNRIYIETHKVGVDVREVNLAGARLAKTAAKGGQLVLGDMSSTGKLLKPSGPLMPEEAVQSYKEQAAILEEGGVDGFIIETMFDLQEALCAVRACKAVSKLPVVASMTFETVKNGGRTVMGNTAQQCAKALTEGGADIIGTNCGNIDPFEMAEIVSIMHKNSSLPIVAQPNAGKPQMVNRQTVFKMSPSEFANGLQECLKAGAQLVGGCCGTSPDHIQAAAEILGKKPHND